MEFLNLAARQPFLSTLALALTFMSAFSSSFDFRTVLSFLVLKQLASIGWSCHCCVLMNELTWSR